MASLKSINQKLEKALANVPKQGPSLLEYLETYMIGHCQRYREMKQVPFGKDPDHSLHVKMERGIIRGLAMAIAQVKYPRKNSPELVKQLEKVYMKRTRQLANMEARKNV